jgi:hypothetical protein
LMSSKTSQLLLKLNKSPINPGKFIAKRHCF